MLGKSRNDSRKSKQHFKITVLTIQLFNLKEEGVCSLFCGMRGGVMVNALDSGAGGIVFLGQTLYSHGASLHPGV